MTEQSFADQIASAKIQGGIVSGKAGFHVPPDHKPPRISAAILQGMMLLFAIIMTTATYMNYMAVGFMQRALDGDFTSEAEYNTAIEPILRWGDLATPVVLTTFVLSVAAYLGFVYFAARNLDRARATGFSHSPGGAVGMSFIPFANLVFIYRIMRDIWVSSHDPRRGAINGSVLLAPWWILYLASNMGSRFLDNLMNAALAKGDVQSATTYVWVAMALCAALAVSCVLLFMIVGGIVRAQAKWSDLPAPAMPAPDAIATPA